MTSVRQNLNAIGKNISIKQIAHQRQKSFPLSLRELVSASPADPPLPPGRAMQKSISLELLQQKFNIFFNERVRPLFQARIHGTRLGASTLTIALDNGNNYDHNNPLITQELAEPGKVLEFDGIVYGTHRFYFRDMKSDRLTLNLVPTSSVGLDINLHFETEGKEVIVEGFPDIDFQHFDIQLKLAFSSNNQSIDLLDFVDKIDATMNGLKVKQTGDIAVLKWAYQGKQYSKSVNTKLSPAIVQQTISSIRSNLIKKYIQVNISVDVTGLPDGKVASKIEGVLKTKLFDAFKLPSVRDALRAIVTQWLVGGNFPITGLASDGQTLTIDYILPNGQLESFPENPQPPLESGALVNIDHIVVLMMENRSFDHMLGYLSKEGNRPDIDGLRGGEKNRYNGVDYASFLLPDTRFLESPPHSHDPVKNQIDGGKMDGFVSAFAKKFSDRPIDPGRIMGYHNIERVPVYNTLAHEFLVCQRWFAAHPGPTFCNRFYTVTGRLNRDSFGNFQFDNPSGDEFKPVLTKTLFDHLSDRAISWRYYEHRYCFLRLFERYTFDTQHIIDAKDPTQGFFASAIAGTLPAVSFIDPNFIDEPDGEDNDDGAPSDITSGQRLISEVVRAVMQGPKWNRTLLVITYDEHGGFYDHVNPLDYREKAKPVSGIDHYGVRVPTLVISPWVERGQVSNIVFDHTSIAKTIIRRFMSAHPPDMGERVAVANDLSMVLQSTARADKPTIPMPNPPVPLAQLNLEATADPEVDDFKEIMRMMRSRYPISSDKISAQIKLESNKH